MAIAVASSAGTAFAVATTITITKPTGTADGDLLVAAIGFESGSATVNSVPSGWNVLQTLARGGNGTITTFYKIAASEGASWQWGLSDSAGVAGGCLRITGHAGVISQSDDGTDTNDDTGDFLGGITPNANSLIIMATMAAQSNSAHSGHAITNDNPTWTVPIAYGPTSTNTLSIAHAVRSQATATGDWTVSVGSGSTADSSSHLIGITPRIDASVSPDVITATASVQAAIAIGHASVSPAVISAVASIIAPTVATPAAKWDNPSKSSAPSWENPDKSV